MNDDYHDYGAAETVEDIEKLIERNICIVNELRSSLSEDDFLREVAMVFVLSKAQTLQLLEKDTLLDDMQFTLGVFSGRARTGAQEVGEILNNMVSWTKDQTAEALLKGLEISKKSQARKGAKAKLSNDPKQAAKKKVLELWKEWRECPIRYKSQSAFARDMLDKFDELGSQSVIEGWCRGWKKTSLS